jgi:hypothetical protein
MISESEKVLTRFISINTAMQGIRVKAMVFNVNLFHYIMAVSFIPGGNRSTR